MSMWPLSTSPAPEAGGYPGGSWKATNRWPSALVRISVARSMRPRSGCSKVRTPTLLTRTSYSCQSWAKSLLADSSGRPRQPDPEQCPDHRAVPDFHDGRADLTTPEPVTPDKATPAPLGAGRGIPALSVRRRDISSRLVISGPSDTILHTSPSTREGVVVVIPHETVPPSFDPTVMSHARAYDYVLGGKDNFEVDRKAAQAVIDLAPDLPALGKAQRRFLLRVVQMCAKEGIDQFLDVGTGIPTAPNVHETARAINPAARVVYVDNDPLVFVHNNALLADDRGVISLQEDVREPRRLLDDPKLLELIDFNKPLLVLFIGLFHLVADDNDPAGVVAQVLDSISPGRIY